MNAHAPLPLLTRTVAARLPTDIGEFTLFHYTNSRDNKEHLALVMGAVLAKSSVLVRVHSECFTGDVLGSRRCDCGEQLQKAMQMLATVGCGVLLYLRQEGRGIGLAEKLRAYNLQDVGYDTVEANLLLGHQADEREYGIAAAILGDLGIQSIRLLTNNPAKVEQLAALGIHIEEIVALPTAIYPDNARYLATKVEKMRHLLTLPQTSQQLATVSAPTLEATGNGQPPAQLLATDQPAATKTPLPAPFEPTAHALPNEPSTAQPTGFSQAINSQLAQLTQRLQEPCHPDRPFVTLSYAQSLDGSIAAQPGHPLRLSSEGAMRLTHTIRSLHEAILVGIGTLLADDPRLTVRLSAGRNPQPIILDSRLRTPPSAKIWQHPLAPWFVVTQPTDDAAQTITAKGGRILPVAADQQGRIDLHALLATLRQLGIRSLMVEGGSQVLSSFLRSGLSDFVAITIAPRFVGGVRVLSDGTSEAKSVLPQIQQPHYTVVDQDLIVWGDIAKEC